MTRLMITLAGSAAAVAGFVALPAPAIAQQAGGTGQIIVYGNDPCPRAADDQVVVCARRPEIERYRIPPKYRPGGTRQETTAWGTKSQALQGLGATGTGSCSAVGPGGFTGCLTQQIEQAKQQRREEAAGNTPPE